MRVFRSSIVSDDEKSLLVGGVFMGNITFLKGNNPHHQGDPTNPSTAELTPSEEATSSSRSRILKERASSLFPRSSIELSLALYRL